MVCSLHQDGIFIIGKFCNQMDGWDHKKMKSLWIMLAYAWSDYVFAFLPFKPQTLLWAFAYFWTVSLIGNVTLSVFQRHFVQNDTIWEHCVGLFFLYCTSLRRKEEKEKSTFFTVQPEQSFCQNVQKKLIQCLPDSGSHVSSIFKDRVSTTVAAV